MSEEEKDIILVLSNISGDNYHDWFINLVKNLDIEQNELFNITYDIWIGNGNSSKKVNDFVINLDSII
ncbi:hypothetical protein D5S05_14820 [Paraclostridium bifermentans]|nr:hypothetical protein D5S05_14820 [Paraclostridium bifermentans]